MTENTVTAATATDSAGTATPELQPTAKARRRTSKPATSSAPTAKAATLAAPADFDTNNAAPPLSKKQTVIAALRATGGASLADLCAATGWQPHSVRGLISTLRGGGAEITCDRDACGVTGYRWIEPATDSRRHHGYGCGDTAGSDTDAGAEDPRT